MDFEAHFQNSSTQFKTVFQIVCSYYVSKPRRTHGYGTKIQSYKSSYKPTTVHLATYHNNETVYPSALYRYVHIFHVWFFLFRVKVAVRVRPFNQRSVVIKGFILSTVFFLFMEIVYCAMFHTIHSCLCWIGKSIEKLHWWLTCKARLPSLETRKRPVSHTNWWLL